MMGESTHRLARTRWAALGAAVAVALGGGGLFLVHAADPSAPTQYVAITPCRLMDTRTGSSNVGPRNTPLGAAETYTVTVHGTNGNCTIPSSATAVVLNATAVNPTAQSFLTLFPADVSRPTASTLNWIAGQAATPNAATVTLSSDGKLKAYNSAGTVNLVLDIVGYYQAPITPIHLDASFPLPSTSTYFSPNSTSSGGTSNPVAVAWMAPRACNIANAKFRVYGTISSGQFAVRISAVDADGIVGLGVQSATQTSSYGNGTEVTIPSISFPAGDRMVLLVYVPSTVSALARVYVTMDCV